MLALAWRLFDVEAPRAELLMLKFRIPIKSRLVRNVCAGLATFALLSTAGVSTIALMVTGGGSLVTDARASARPLLTESVSYPAIEEFSVTRVSAAPDVAPELEAYYLARDERELLEMSEMGVEPISVSRMANEFASTLFHFQSAELVGDHAATPNVIPANRSISARIEARADDRAAQVRELFSAVSQPTRGEAELQREIHALYLDEKAERVSASIESPQRRSSARKPYGPRHR